MRSLGCWATKKWNLKVHVFISQRPKEQGVLFEMKSGWRNEEDDENTKGEGGGDKSQEEPPSNESWG